MHPLLAKGRLGLYLAAWLPIAGLLTVLVRLAAAASWLEAAVLVAPLALVFAFICLASWYPCRALPLSAAQLPRTILTHTLAALVATVVWLFLAATWSAVLEPLPAFAGLAQRFPRIAVVLAASGVILYALAATLHCAVRAGERAATAEAEGLRQTLAAQAAELRALKAQVNPHFLFNALNSIAGIAGGEPETVRRSCVLLADFLRETLRATGMESIPLREELALVDRYLAIERLRFGPRLGFALRVPEECLAIGVPPLILQPLVENAVVRGIASLVGGGTVTIEAARDGRELRVSITNPFDVAAPVGRGEGLGLDNVRARLAAAHGASATLDARADGEWFRAELRIPQPATAAGAPAS